MRILISRLSSLGDVVCTLPVAPALRALYPEAHLAWAVEERYADVPAACSAVDEIIPVRPRLQPSTWPVFPEPFDIALDMQGLFKSAIVVKRSGAAIRLGYHWQREGAALFSRKVLPDPTSLHVVDQYVDVVRALGAKVDRAEFGLSPLPEHVASMRELGLAKPYVLVNAGAGWATKRWPASSFATMIDGLAGKAMVALIGGGDAEAIAAADAVLAACQAPAPANLLGKTSIGQLIALVAGAAVHIGGDTGSTHLAAALGVPAVGLYSITRPERCCPYGQIERTHYDPASLAAIEPSQVLNSVIEALST